MVDSLRSALSCPGMLLAMSYRRLHGNLTWLCRRLLHRNKTRLALPTCNTLPKGSFSQLLTGFLTTTRNQQSWTAQMNRPRVTIGHKQCHFGNRVSLCNPRLGNRRPKSLLLRQKEENRTHACRAGMLNGKMFRELNKIFYTNVSQATTTAGLETRGDELPSHALRNVARHGAVCTASPIPQPASQYVV